MRGRRNLERGDDATTEVAHRRGVGGEPVAPTAEAWRLYEVAGGPNRLELPEGRGHIEWVFHGHPTLPRMVDLIAGFLLDDFAVHSATATF